MTTVRVETPHGPARAELHCADEGRAWIMVGHGAGGGVDAPDLVALTRAATAEGVHVALVEQPYRVAGRRAPAPMRTAPERPRMAPSLSTSVDSAKAIATQKTARR